jgi:UPF0755 protein
MKYQLNVRSANLHKRLLIAAWIIIILIIGGVLALRGWYVRNLNPVSSVQTTRYFTITEGESTHQIAVNLKAAGLIRSASAFETYVRSRQLLVGLQAGTYELSPSMSVQDIVKKLTSGDIAKNLVTILPARRLEQIRPAFAKAGYSPGEIDKAFNAATYSDHPLLKGLPSGISLEGLLYPDSFQKSPNTPAEALVRQSLDLMYAKLTPDVQAGFGAQGLNLYQGIILASVVYRETDNPQYQPTVAQVFLTRLKVGMRLESDATNSTYNTYQNPGMPPEPISNMTNPALNAVAHPANTDFLFFVAGDDGRIHFSHTQAEHEANVRKYCTKLCAQ